MTDEQEVRLRGGPGELGRRSAGVAEFSALNSAPSPRRPLGLP